MRLNSNFSDIFEYIHIYYNFNYVRPTRVIYYILNRYTMKITVIFLAVILLMADFTVTGQEQFQFVA